MLPCQGKNRRSGYASIQIDIAFEPENILKIRQPMSAHGRCGPPHLTDQSCRLFFIHLELP